MRTHLESLWQGKPFQHMVGDSPNGFRSQCVSVDFAKTNSKTHTDSKLDHFYSIQYVLKLSMEILLPLNASRRLLAHFCEKQSETNMKEKKRGTNISSNRENWLAVNPGTTETRFDYKWKYSKMHFLYVVFIMTRTLQYAWIIFIHYAFF